MPYASNEDLPPAVKKLSGHQQTIFRKAFNNALKEYKGDEKKAYATAWAAAKGKTERAVIDFTKIQEQIRAFDPDYAITEACDAIWALQAMTSVIELMKQEARQGEEQHVKDLVDIYIALDKFVDEELQEALAGEEDGAYGDDGDDGQGLNSMYRAAESKGEKAGEGGHSGYLVSEDGQKHLPTRKGGKPDHRLMGAAWAALHGGYRGKKYAGPGKQAAISKLKKMYEAEGMDTPSERSISEDLVNALVLAPQALRMAGETHFSGYAFLWPKDPREKDLLDTYFKPDTDYGDFMDRAPVLYHHGMNEAIDLEKIGKAVRAEIDEIGLWVEGELDKSKKFWRGVAELIKQKKLFLSPGSAGHLLRYAEDGALRSYPIVEYSLTPQPAQPRLNPVSFLRSVGIDVDGEGDGARSPKGERPLTGDGQKPGARNTRTASQISTNLLEVNMEPKELAEMIAASTQAAVRAAMQADKEAQATAAAALEAERKRVSEEEAKQKALIEKVTAEVRASFAVDPQARPALNGGAGGPGYNPLSRDFGQFNLVQHTGEFSYLKAVRGIVLAHHGKDNAWKGSEKEREIMTKYADEVRSTLSENIGNLGAYLVPPQYVQEQFIPLLRSRAVVRAANPVILQASSNVVYIPSQTGGATAYWVGENATITASNLTVGQVAITIKKLAGLEYVSNELLADSNPSVDMLMRNDLAAVLALAEDTAYLTSDGTLNAPVGMSNFSGITSLTCASDGGNGGLIQALDIFSMKRKMMQNNIPNDGWAWFSSPRTWDEIAQLKDSQSRYLLETLTGGNIAQYPAYGTYPQGPETNYLGSVVGRLLGWPLFVTNNIPETQTQGTSNLASSLYLARMPDVIIAERAGLELMATNVAGTSFASDQTWIRAIMRVGFTIRHAPGVTVMKGLL